MTGDEVYYRVRASDGAVFTLQWLDEYHYDPNLWLTDDSGHALKFDDQQSALEEYRRRKPKPKVLGYIVVDREGDIVPGHPYMKLRTAEVEAKIRTEDCKQAGIDWDYHVAQIVELEVEK